MVYKIERSQRKTVTIQIRHQHVIVRAPLRLPLGIIDAFVSAKEEWIQKKLTEQARKADERFEISHGRTIPYKGQLKELICLEGGRNQIEMNDSTITIRRHPQSSTAHSQLFEQWLKTKARHELKDRTQILATRMGVENKLKEIRFRKTRSKWGHCSADGIIQFNWLIMMAPEFVIDYVVAHELCHLIHFNHSTLFWKHVERLQPDYPMARHWLKTKGHTLWLK